MPAITSGTLTLLDKMIKSPGANLLQSTENKTNSTLVTAFILIIILQSYLAPLIAVASGGNPNTYVNYYYLYVIISYTIIVSSIIIFHGRGLDVFQDYFSLSIIVLTCFVRAGLGGDNENIYRGILMLLGFVLLNFMITNRKYIKLPPLKSLLVGLLWSIVAVVGMALFRVLLSKTQGTLTSTSLSSLIYDLFYQLSFYAVIEEAYFRGLIFGFLVMNGYKENTALAIQAVLFWGIHYTRIGDPLFFLIILPFFTLLATWIIKRYKMLYLSVMMHTICNVFEPILVALFYMR